MQGKAARRAGDPSHQSEEPPPEGFGGRDPFTQADAGCPAGQVVRHHLYRQPGAVGGEAPRGHVVQPDAVLEVAYRILDLGVAAMISLQFQHLPIPVGDEAVIAVGGEEGELGTGRGLHPPDDEPHRRGVGFTLEGGIGGLGHIGGAVHPVGNRRPVLLGDRLDQLPQAFVLADGDGEADTHFAADGDESVGIEAAVGAHRELAAGPTVAHPPHCFTQEVGSAASGVGAALAQPGHQHVAGSGSDGQQWVIAPLAGVAVVSRSFLSQSIGLADGRIQVDGQRRIAGSGPSGPCACQQLAAHPVELTDVPPAKAAQEGPEGGWRLDHAAENTGRPTSTQRIRVVDAVAARQRGSDQRQQLVPRVGPPRRAARVEVTVDEFPQAQVLGEGGRQEQAGIGHQAVVIKDDADPVGIVLWQHLLGDPCFQAVFCSKTIIPDSEEHPLASSRTVPKVVFRWIRAYTEEQEQFRKEVRAWIEESVPENMKEPIDGRDFTEEQYRFWLEKHKEMGSKGWLYPTHPTEYGGGGLTGDHETILSEELHNAKVPWSGSSLLFAALLVWGTEEQKQKFLPLLTSGGKTAWQKLTEPKGGADLANYQSRAVRDGDDWLLTGQNVFISGCPRPEWTPAGPDYLYGPMLTDPEAPRHRNLGYFIVPVNSPGLEIKEMNLLPGYDQHAIFMDSVRVPGDHLIGGDHQGWQVLSTHLDQEHGGRGQAFHRDQVVDNLVSYARDTKHDGGTPGNDPVLQQTTVEAYNDSHVDDLLAKRTYWMYQGRMEMSYEGNVHNVHNREQDLRNAIRVRDVMGLYALLDGKDPGSPHGGAQEVNQRSKAGQRHAAGSNNIPKVILSRRIGISRTQERAAPTPSTATRYGS